MTLLPRECFRRSFDLQFFLGLAIRARRIELRWTQSELARHALTRRPLVARAEAGRHALCLDSLVRYAGALGCTVSDLVLDAERQAARFAEGQTRARSPEVQSL